MFEYEFRLVVTCDRFDYENFFENYFSYLKGDHSLFVPKSYRVFYVQPHFRMKERHPLEWKRKLSTVTIYHDGLWFRMVESEEVPFEKWSRNVTSLFLENAGHYSDPVSTEFRREVTSTAFENLKLYAFRKFERTFGLVFEFEVARSEERVEDLSNFAVTLAHSSLSFYRFYYSYLRKHAPFLPSPSLFAFSNRRRCGKYIRLTANAEGEEGGEARVFLSPTRKTVAPVSEERAEQMLLSSFASGVTFLLAPKHDGTFGFVYSRSNCLREIWEDNLRRVRPDFTLGTDLVFGAERKRDGSVVLLDVYEVRGSPVRTTEKLLTEYLPDLEKQNFLPPGYRVQTYRRCERKMDSCSNNNSRSIDNVCIKEDANEKEEEKGKNFVKKWCHWIEEKEEDYDGIVLHDVTADKVYKVKVNHTVDLVHFDGHFLLPDGRKLKCPDNNTMVLENGTVYECMPETLIPVRKRPDRFVGNSAKQLAMLAAAAGTESLAALSNVETM